MNGRATPADQTPLPNAPFAQSAPVLAALLLGGGHGKRAGGPKALKIKDGIPLWQWQCHQLRSQGCAPVIAVLHPSAWPVQADHADCTVAADPDATLFASLQLGLAEVPYDHAVLVLPVDCPLPSRAVVESLRQAVKDADQQGIFWSLIRPALPSGQAGHPIVLSAAWQTELRALDARTARLDQLSHQLERRRIDVVCEDPGILANFNVDGIGL